MGNRLAGIPKNNDHTHADIGRLLAAPKYRDAYAHLAAHRIIFLSEDITTETAENLSCLLLHYDAVSEEPISLHLSTNGGSAAALCQILDVMAMVRSPIRTVCFAKAYSAGSLILAAGTKGHRFMTKNAFSMIHGIQSGSAPGGQKATAIYLDFLKAHNRQILEILARHTGQPIEKVEEDCSKDTFLSAEESKAYGLIDHIL